MSVWSVDDESFDYSKFPELVELVERFNVWQRTYEVLEFIEFTGPESRSRISSFDSKVIWTEWKEKLVCEVFPNDTDTWGWFVVKNPYPQLGFAYSELDTEIEIDCPCCDGDCDSDCECADCEGEAVIIFKAF